MKEPKQYDSNRSEEFRKLIPAFLAGDLDEKRSRILEEYLSENQQLRSEMERLFALWERLPDRAPPSSPVDLWSQLRTRLEEERLAVFTIPPSRWKMAVSFAAGVILGLGIWLLGTGGPSISSASTQELLAHEIIFESMDPIPPESMAGIYLSMLPIDENTP